MCFGYSKMQPLPAQTPKWAWYYCTRTPINYKLIIGMLGNKHSLLLLSARTIQQFMKSLEIRKYSIRSVNEQLHSIQGHKLKCHALFFTSSAQRLPSSSEMKKLLGWINPLLGLKSHHEKESGFLLLIFNLTEWLGCYLQKLFCFFYIDIYEKHLKQFPFQVHLFGTICLNNRCFLL